ncbi:hypothetical protein DFH07DRAFT_1057660 [Mycena maculata]|uniref:Uncharacterized protein n=1 Tax=Mycena maculata TaxID=230809 RepID=A0AAD7NQG1_9AGAR|nr:hypothetical protein DFH07DRAFT_1057660 [Mycena maculata]
MWKGDGGGHIHSLTHPFLPPSIRPFLRSSPSPFCPSFIAAHSSPAHCPIRYDDPTLSSTGEPVRSAARPHPPPRDLLHLGAPGRARHIRGHVADGGAGGVHAELGRERVLCAGRGVAAPLPVTSSIAFRSPAGIHEPTPTPARSTLPKSHSALNGIERSMPGWFWLASSAQFRIPQPLPIHVDVLARSEGTLEPRKCFYVPRTHPSTTAHKYWGSIVFLINSMRCT